MIAASCLKLITNCIWGVGKFFLRKSTWAWHINFFVKGENNAIVTFPYSHNGTICVGVLARRVLGGFCCCMQGTLMLCTSINECSEVIGSGNLCMYRHISFAKKDIFFSKKKKKKKNHCTKQLLACLFGKIPCLTFLRKICTFQCACAVFNCPVLPIRKYESWHFEAPSSPTSL